jgi:WD40 repeat protein
MIYRYGPKNSILFFTSAIAVRMHKDVADPNDEAATEGATGLWQQKFMFDHDAPITCIDYCPATNMCATADCTDGALGVSKDGTASQRESRIVFWNASSVEPHGTIDVQQCAGIRYLDFSIDGSRILALANDEHNTLMIFDTTRKALIYSVILGKGKVMAVSFAKVASMFCVASSIGTEFFLEDIGMYGAKEGVTSYTRYPALFHATGEPVRSSLTFSLSDSEFEDEMISGTADGAMVLWRGKSCISLLVGAHEGPITSIHYNKHCKLIVSGGTDGKVKMYRIVDPASIKLTRKGTLKISGRNAVSTAPTTRYLEIIASIDILIGDVLSKLVRSVNLSDDGTKVVVSTRSGEISEFAVTGAIKSKMDEIISPVAVEGAEGEEGGTSAPPATDGEEGEKVRYIGDDINGGPIIKSHWDNCLTQFGETRITGLCKIPVGNGGGFLSCGNDFTVRRWQAADGSDHKETKRYVFDAGCAGMGASGTHVAVYFDGTGNAIRSKELHILAIEAFHTQQVIHDLPDAISVVQFSADGSHIAVGFSSGLVIIYNAVEGQPYNEKTRLSSGTSAVFKIDFSADGVYIRVAYSDETLVYYDIMTNIGNSPAEAEVMRAIQWYTHSVPFTWDNKGAFSEVAADEAILCVDRSNHLVISALSSGAIMLTRLPNTGVIEPGTKVFRAVKQEAHCGKISAICYIDDGAKLVTAGATDGLIQVWKVTYDFDEGEPDSEIKEQEEPEVDEGMSLIALFPVLAL